MTPKRSGKTRIPWNKLFEHKDATLAYTLLGLFYFIFPWMTSGILDEKIAIFGLMFITIAVMKAKGSNTVLGGLFAAFIGVIYLSAVGGVVSVAALWTLTVLLAIAFFVFEMGFFRVGPISKKADAFQIVPFTLMTFALLISITGYSPIFRIDWSRDMLVALNYVAIFLVCALSTLQLAGWNIAGKNTNKWIMVCAVAAIGIALFGTYQGTLWQWT